MPRFVRCPEGHVFDAEGSNLCPVCGALVGVGPIADAAAPVDAQEMPAAVSATTGGKGSRNIITIIGAGVVIAGVIAFLALRDRSTPPEKPEPPKEQASQATPAPRPPPEQPARTEPPPQREASAPAKPPERADNAAQPPAAPAPSSKESSAEAPARATLPAEERSAINAKYQALLARLVRDRDLAPIPGGGTRLGTYPDASAAPSTSAVASAPVAAAAAQGGWSDDATATAEDLRARGENTQGGKFGGGVPIMENGMWLGSPLSIGLLGDWHFQALAGFPRDRQTGLAMLRLSADRGDMWSATRLMNIYLKGEGVEKDEAEARRYFLVAYERQEEEAAKLVAQAKNRQRSAIGQLSQMVVSPSDLPVTTVDVYRGRTERGLGATAIELLDRAGRSDILAMYALVLMAEKDEAISFSPKARMMLTREAARRGHAQAMNHLGEILLNGPAELQNPAEAALWFFAAFRFGFPPPGDKVPKDNYIAATERMTRDQVAAFVAVFESVLRYIKSERLRGR